MLNYQRVILMIHSQNPETPQSGVDLLESKSLQTQIETHIFQFSWGKCMKNAHKLRQNG